MTATNGHGPDEEWGPAESDWRISLIQSAQGTATSPTTFRSILAEITSPKWADPVSAVRAAYASGGKDAASEPKKRLPGVLFSGEFSYRADSKITAHSGLICADLDELGATLENTFELVCADPHTLACFRSPTGTGLKVVMKIDPAKPHIEGFHALEHYMLEHFGLEIDQSCKNVSRICFVSHDPEAFVAADAEILPYPPPAKEFAPAGLNPRSGLELTPGDDYDARGDFPALLTAHGWTKCPGGWTRPGKTMGVSATFDKVPGRFYCFSSSVPGMAANHVYRPWHVYTILEHGGDFPAAARELGKKGFGTPAPSRQQQNLERVAGPKEQIPPEEAREAALKALFARRVTSANPPKEPVTRLFLAGKPIATPGNLQTMTAKAKTGKTAATGATVAAVICAATGTTVLHLDTFKFTASNPAGHAVIVIDTEQSPYDAWTCYQRNLQRAGTEQDPAWLLHFALVGYTVAKRKEALALALEYAKTTFGGVFLVILDGVAHFVSSVNELEECNTLADWLRELSVNYDTAMLCIIHSNEGLKTGDDSRGHLGKQLMRDAESNLLLKKTGEVTTITSERQRKAPITEQDEVAFKWSDEHQRHVTCITDPESKAKKGGRPKEFTYPRIEKFIPEGAAKAMPLNAIFNFAKDIGVGESTFRGMMEEAVEKGWCVRIKTGAVGQYYRP